MKFNDKVIKSGTTVAVGISGGRDSVALLHYLKENKDKLNITLKAICVEHGIRESAKKEAVWVQKICESWGIPLKIYSVNAIEYSRENKLTVEQGARELRYQCFSDAKTSGFCDYVATAHHLLDNVETVLMRVFRGTGIKGLSGIKDERDYFIRPILSATREEIDEYISENGLTYFDDETNDDTIYTRNFIRHELVPKIKEKYPKMEESILRLSRLASIDEEYFDEIIKDKIIKLDNNAWGVDIKDTKSPAVFSRLVRRAFALLGVNQDVEDRHVELLLVLANGENAESLDMPYGVVATKEYDNLVFYKKEEIVFPEIPLLYKDYEIDGTKYYVEKIDKRDSLSLCIDFDKAEGAVFRTRKKGDYFKRFGGGTKSLGDYLTDIKLPVRLRDRIIVLARKSEVLAVLGVEISENVKIDKSTKKMIKLGGKDDVLRR